MKCPLCFGKVLYVGLNVVECDNNRYVPQTSDQRKCQNYKEGPAVGGVSYGPEPVDFYWACAWAAQVARGLGCLDQIRVEEGPHRQGVSAMVYGLPQSPLSFRLSFSRDFIREWCLIDQPDWAPYL